MSDLTDLVWFCFIWFSFDISRFFLAALHPK